MNQTVQRYLWMSQNAALHHIDYHIDGQEPIDYAFGIPVYDPQDYLDLMENRDACIKKITDMVFGAVFQ